MDRKTRHENFVSGFAGGAIIESYGVTAVCVLGSIVHFYVSRVVQDGPARFISDFIFNWFVVVASVTFYANKLWLLSGVLALTGIAAYLAQHRPSAVNAATNKQTKKTKRSPKAAASKESSTKSETAVSNAVYRPFITSYRSSMMALTVTAILAVDFPAFPRRFAKTETWGTSLMDLGVGSFVFSLGIVSARKELKANGKHLPFTREVVISIKQTLKVLALGFIRFLFVKSFDYHEHVSEYGVHWNFFFTLGMLPVSFTLLRRLLSKKLSYTYQGLLVGIVNELALKNTGLQEWALAAPRTNLFAQNKEGIVSFSGYLAIFTFGYALGLSVLSAKSSVREIVKCSAKWCVVAQVLFVILRTATEPSRRLANLPYIAWVVAFNSGFILLLAIVEQVTGMQPSSSYVAINKFGETTFILANLLTGLVNISFDTLLLGNTGTLLVMVPYLLVVMVLSMIRVRS